MDIMSHRIDEKKLLGDKILPFILILFVSIVAAKVFVNYLDLHKTNTQKIEKMAEPYILVPTKEGKYEKVLSSDKRFDEFVRKGYTLVYDFSPPSNSDK